MLFPDPSGLFNHFASHFFCSLLLALYVFVYANSSKESTTAAASRVGAPRMYEINIWCASASLLFELSHVLFVAYTQHTGTHNIFPVNPASFWLINIHTFAQFTCRACSAQIKSCGESCKYYSKCEETANIITLCFTTFLTWTANPHNAVANQRHDIGVTERKPVWTWMSSCNV